MGYNWQKFKMKKIIYSLSIVFLFAGMTLMTSCKPEKKVLGKWEVVYARIDSDKDDIIIGETWTFKENGKFIGALSEDEVVECDYSFDGKTLTFSGGDLKYEDIYEKEQYTITLDVEELSKQKMSLSGKCKYEYYNYSYITYEKYVDSFTLSYELEKKK